MNETKHDDGGTAYPVIESGPFGVAYTSRGMSLLDYFAGQALKLTEFHCDAGDAGVCDPAAHAKAAYQIASAMLAEREARRG